MAANAVPQSMLYNTGYGNLINNYRDRSQEQQTVGNQTVNPTTIPMFNYQFDPSQSSSLGRYQPPMLSDPFSGASTWSNQGQGGYSYNLPNAYGSPYANSYAYNFTAGNPSAPSWLSYQQGLSAAGGQSPQSPVGQEIARMQQNPFISGGDTSSLRAGGSNGRAAGPQGMMNQAIINMYRSQYMPYFQTQPMPPQSGGQQQMQLPMQYQGLPPAGGNISSMYIPQLANYQGSPYVGAPVTMGG